MIEVLFKKKKDKIIFFEVKGHADLSTYGTDIVCASVSSTTLMVLNGILEVLKLKPKYKVEEGYTLCDCSSLNNVENLEPFMESFYLFIEELAKQYPKNLKFKVMEV